MIGEILGNRYEVKEKIGEGGMSIVYLAYDNKLCRNVAVKVLKNELTDNDDIVRKFKREATAIATLSDSNIVNVLDVGSQDGVNYIVMEYVKGKTLKDLIVGCGQLSYETTAQIGMQIGKALDCAHRNNIIHRDVKPQNILLTEEGIIKVTDFGIAKSASSATLTNTTTIMGSAQYFSPEQAKGSVVDTRTDIYSFGVVLYEMATGKLPFQADSPVTIALKHIQEAPVPPKELNPKIPESLNRIILKAMEKDANNRYQTVKELMADLQRVKENPNAQIVNDEEDNDDGRTIVMSAVNPSMVSKPAATSADRNSYDDDDDYDEDDDYDDDYDEDDDYDDDDYDDDDRKKSKSKKKINGKLIAGIIGIILLLAVGVGAAKLLGGSSSKEKVTIPNIEGMTIDEAKTTLSKLGLQLEEGGTEESDKPEGTILEVYPSEGTEVAEGTKVRVVVSGGETKIKVPSLQECSEDEAITILKKSKLTNYEIVKQNHATIPQGYVISTEPGASTEVAADTKITVYVSSGPAKDDDSKKVSVPALKGLAEASAKGTLEDKGLACNVEYQDTTDQSENGKVVHVNPGEGEKVKKGATITITVGKYKAPEKTKINISNLGITPGMTKADAQARAQSMGIKVIFTGQGDLVDSVPSGTVEEGGTITVGLKEAPKAKVTVSDVLQVGMSKADAKAAVEKKGLKADFSGTGDVLASVPSGSYEVGSKVTLQLKEAAVQETPQE